MLWSLTLSDTSQGGANFTLNQFYLQKGDQINDPAPGEQTYYATGPVVGGQEMSIQAGETEQAIITFSFVPYKGIKYTLFSELLIFITAETSNFNPVLFTF